MIPQAVILLGGKGTRIAAQFPDRPKALIPVHGRPFLEWQFDWLTSNGITRVVLAAGYKADILERYLDARPADALQIVLSREPAPLGTGGALKFIEPLLATDPVLVLNGDTLAPNLSFCIPEKPPEEYDADSQMPWLRREEFRALDNPDAFFHAVENCFPRCGKLFVAPVTDAGRYGTVEFDDKGFVKAFREKANQRAGFINAGIYLLPRERISALPDGRPVSMENDIFPSLARHRNLVALPCPPPLLDMGTPEGLDALEQYLAQDG